MLDDWLGKFHFWDVSPCLPDLLSHALSWLSEFPRRDHEHRRSGVHPPSAHQLNALSPWWALTVGFAQMVFLFNLVWSLFRAGLQAAIHGGPPR